MSFLVFLISFVVAVFPFFFLYGAEDWFAIGAFLPLSLLLGFLTYFSIKFENLVFSSVLCFFSLFFVIAPVMQLSHSGYFLVNTMYVSVYEVVLANVYTFCFVLVFFFSYLFMAKKYEVESTFLKVDGAKLDFYKICFGVVVCLVLALFAAYELFFSFAENDGSDLIFITIKYKVLYFFPFVFFCFLFYGNGLSFKGKFFLLLTVFVCLLATKNFFFEKRNAIGPLYLTIFLMFFPFVVRDIKRYISFLYLTLLVFFPASSVLTHGDEHDFSLESLMNAIRNHFLDIHYDAWANLVAVIELVEMYGYSFGKQLLGTILVLIPRSFWPEKPDPTGIVIGDYLTNYHSMWFNNLSAPLVAEAWIDFGLLGVVFFPIFLSRIVFKLKSLACRGGWFWHVFYLYMSFYIVFLLRGSLSVSLMYLFGAMIVFYFVEVFFSKRRGF